MMAEAGEPADGRKRPANGPGCRRDDMQRIWLVASGLLIGGCAHKPIETTENYCEIRRYLVDVEGVPDQGMESSGMQSLEAVVASATGAAADPHLLFLSGGSQYGAFGAGYLGNWKDRDGNLPRFRVVTGISTGALLATPAFANRPEAAIAGYTINKEGEILKAHGSGLFTVVRHGAAGRLDPLRQRLDGLLDDDMLEAVAEGHDNVADPRKLLVAAVDLDLGKTVAFDMTELASRWSAASGARKKRLKQCYIEALIASSSVPGAAPPTYIDNRLYIDGGARFGVLAEALGAKLNDEMEMEAGPLPGRLTIIVNGTMETDARCGKAGVPKDDAAAVARCAGSAGLQGRHRGWDILSVAERSISILINQIYRLSVDYAARVTPARVTLVKMDPRDATAHSFAMDGITRSCSDWRKMDKALDNPIEFHPRQMRCLIDYGRSMSVREGQGAPGDTVAASSITKPLSKGIARQP